MHNNKNLTQTRFAQIRAVDTTATPENRTYEFVISSETPDSYGTVFTADGWDMTRYASNPVVCWNHRSHSDDPDDTIGLGEVFREGNDWIGRVTLEEGNPKADKLKRKLDNGTIRGASIGAMVHDGAFGDKERGQDPDLVYFTRQELVEWSIVSTPSNADAVKRNKESINTAFAKAEQQQHNGLDNQSSRATKTAPLDEFEAAYIFNKNNQ